MIWIIMFLCLIFIIISANLQESKEELEEIKTTRYRYEQDKTLNNANNKFNFFIATLILSIILFLTSFILLAMNFSLIKLGCICILLAVFSYKYFDESFDEFLSILFAILATVFILWGAMDLALEYPDTSRYSFKNDSENIQDLAEWIPKGEPYIEKYELVSLNNVTETETNLEANLHGYMLSGGMFSNNYKNIKGTIDASEEEIEYYKFFFYNNDGRAEYKKIDTYDIQLQFTKPNENPYYQVTYQDYIELYVDEETGIEIILNKETKQYNYKLVIHEDMFNKHIGLDFKE